MATRLIARHLSLGRSRPPWRQSRCFPRRNSSTSRMQKASYGPHGTHHPLFGRMQRLVIRPRRRHPKRTMPGSPLAVGQNTGPAIALRRRVGGDTGGTVKRMHRGLPRCPERLPRTRRGEPDTRSVGGSERTRRSRAESRAFSERSLHDVRTPVSCDFERGVLSRM